MAFKIDTPCYLFTDNQREILTGLTNAYHTGVTWTESANVVIEQTVFPCFGENALLKVNVSYGLAPYTYIWKNLTGDTLGTSSTLVTTRGEVIRCYVTDSLNITNLSVSYTVLGSDLNGASVYTQNNNGGMGSPNGIIDISPNGTQTPFQYLWSSNDPMWSWPNVKLAYGLVGGFYQCIISDAWNCSTTVYPTILDV